MPDHPVPPTENDSRSEPAARAAWERWHHEREAALAVTDGWLTLVGFAWLATDPGPVDGLPGQWWSDGDTAYVGAVAADDVVADGKVVDGIVGATVAESGSLRWLDVRGTKVELIRRGGRFALRLRRSDSTALQQFSGVPVFAYDPAWVVRGTVRPYGDGPRDQEVATARDDLRQRVWLDGEITLRLDGQEVVLHATDNRDGTWRFAFHDPTNGAQTARWRSASTGVPTADGTLEIDLNRAVNLPFAFSEFGTCPAPPPGNLVPVAVTAGEKAPA